MKLGALVYLRSTSEHPIELASPPTCQFFEDSGWKLRIRGSSAQSRPMQMKNGWTRFNYGNIATTGMATREIRSPLVANNWLPQANYILSSLDITSNFKDYRITESIDYLVSFSNMSEVSPKGGYLFLCPFAHLGSREGSFGPPKAAAYWSLEPSGTKRLSDRKAMMLGFPCVTFKMKVWTRTWDRAFMLDCASFTVAKDWIPIARMWHDLWMYHFMSRRGSMRRK
ncbi:hypothetical protein K438DRAFT_133768 [Mycena galopus ATCC 62051]|nr:hypothetical protein K438DRAFT_133768 [Mycena galopus ATCC 62051]